LFFRKGNLPMAKKSLQGGKAQKKLSAICISFALERALHAEV